LDIQGVSNQTQEGEPSATSPRGVARRAISPAHSLLGLSLFWKILLANLALAGVSAAAGAGLATATRTATAGTIMTTGIMLGVLVILISLAVNAVLIRFALSPLEDLKNAAERIRKGDTNARAQLSPLADSSVREVSEVVNDMLEVLSFNRTRQQELARRVLESEERERQLIAHELYSGTAQTLAGVLVRLRIAERHQGTGTTGSIEEIREEVVNALEEVRGVARRLRPPELDELGVRVALEAHARSMTEGKRIETRFSGALPQLSREISLALFRILQEAISNVAIHADAENLTVRFDVKQGSVVAEVEDDGSGFDLATALRQTGGSLGLFGMHERAGYVRGELSLESGPGLGTRLRVVIPLESDVSVESQVSQPLSGTVDRLMDGIVRSRKEGVAAGAPTGKREHLPL
jgi:two-component system sensor histidine kinase UhpB